MLDESAKVLFTSLGCLKQTLDKSAKLYYLFFRTFDITAHDFLTGVQFWSSTSLGRICHQIIFRWYHFCINCLINIIVLLHITSRSCIDIWFNSGKWLWTGGTW